MIHGRGVRVPLALFSFILSVLLFAPALRAQPQNGGQWEDSGVTTLLRSSSALDVASAGLTQSLNLTLRGNVVSAGVGLASAGAGTIHLQGVPAGATIVVARLYWVTIGNGPSSNVPTLNGTPVPGEMVGQSGDTCWDAAGNFAYRATVTHLVSGNGDYQIAGLPSTGGPFRGDRTDDSQGASLVVVYSLASDRLRTVIINDGAMSCNSTVPSLADTIGGFDVGSVADPVARATYLVGDGQSSPDGELRFGSLSFGEVHFQGTAGAHWDNLSFDVSQSPLTAPVSTTLSCSYSGGGGDCLVWAATIVAVDIEDPGVTLSLGPGTATCQELYQQTLSVADLSDTPVASFEFDIVFPSAVIAPSSDVPAEVLGPWEVLVELDGSDRLHIVVQSPTYPEPQVLPDGEILNLFWVPLVDVPQPPDLPLPVPVTIDPDSIVGLEVPPAVELGFVTLGVPRNPRVHVGSTSVFAGQEAIVPVSIEGLCQVDPIFGNYTPHRHYQLEVEFNAAGLGDPTATLEGTVVPDWTIIEAGSPDVGRFEMDADALISDVDPEKDLKDGVIAYLRFPTSTEPGSFTVRPVSLFVEAAPIVINGREGAVEVKRRECDRPEDILLSWEEFAALVDASEPSTTNRTCTPAHFARFAFYQDELSGETNLLMTQPLTFETRGTVTELQRIIQPPDADRSCVNNRVVITGWVSYGDWNPMFRLGQPGGKQFLFTNENFAAALGRIEPGTEFFRDRTGALESHLEAKSGEKIFPRHGQTIIFPNYPEPDGEFPASNPAGLMSMKRNDANVSFWVDDARLAVEYVNDPEERAEQGVTMNDRGILFSDRNGRRLSFGAKEQKGIYTQSCAGKIAATPRLLFKHSSMWGGAHVRGAGEIIAQRGRLCYINNGSGHYKPDEDQFEFFLRRTFPMYEFRQFQPSKGIVWTIPEPLSEVCEDAVHEEVGLWPDTWRLELDAPVNRKGRGTIGITNYGDAREQVELKWPPRATWLRASPMSRTIGPDRTAGFQFVGQCGPNPGERSTRFWLQGENGNRVSPWLVEIVLRCHENDRR